MAAGDKKAANIASGGPYVFLKGGPYHGAYYSVGDWQVTRDAEKWGLEHGEQRPEVMGLYRESKDSKDLQVCHDPKLPGLVGRVWKWTGSREPLNAAGRRSR